MKRGRKIAVGTQSGVINLFTWGAWNDCSDRFVGHPASVDSLVKVSAHS
jgi:WD repeat-containing protein 55